MIMKNGKGEQRGPLVAAKKLTGEDNEENDCDVDEEKLEVPEVTEDLSNKKQADFIRDTSEILNTCLQPAPERGGNTHRVEQSHSNVLDHAVEGHELEHAEGGDEGSAALPVKITTKEEK